MKQIILTIGLAVSMLLSSLPSYAYDFEVDGIYYSVISPTDLTCEVVAGDNKYAGDVNIPSSVTYKSKQLDVISIGASAFEGCTGLTSVTIGNSVTSIGSVAFRGCIRLTGVTIGNSVTEIGRRAFMDCTGLTSIDIPDSVTKIGDSAFSGCTRLTSVDIPDSVTEINYCAFSGCTGLTSVDIPDSVTEIGSSAFEGCTGLTGVDIPDSVTSIGGSAFADCTSLTEVKISANVTELYAYWTSSKDNAIFYGCSNIVNLTFNDSVEKLTLDNRKEYHSSVSSFPSPFYSLQLKELYLGREINLKIYDSYYIYKYPETLEKITFGPKLSDIGDFYRRISTIPTSAVIYCLNPTPPAFGNDFANSQYINNTVYVPKESLEAYQQADGWKNFWDMRAYDPDSGIEDMKAAEYQGYVVYDMQGNMVLKTENKAELNTLARGIYIVNGKKVLLP